jgi:hypothetical protein
MAPHDEFGLTRRGFFLQGPLIILDATEGCFDGGPAPQNSQTVWRENAIYVATDRWRSI